MKVLVFSDSHGALNLAEEMLRREADCPVVFFLGNLPQTKNPTPRL